MDLGARVPDRCMGDVPKTAPKRKRSDRSADEGRRLRRRHRTGGSEHPPGVGA
jgi:hypothetical protein